MEPYISMKSLKGAEVTLRRDGNMVRVLALAPSGRAEGLLNSIADDTLTLSNGATIMLSAEDAARARAYQEQAATMPAAMSLASKIGIGVVAVLGALFIVGSLMPHTPAPPPSETVAATPTAAAIGTTVRTGNVEISVVKAQLRDSVGDQYLHETAAEGGVLVAIDYKIKNVGDKPLKSYDQPHLKLIDPSGTEYEPDAGKSATYATETTVNRKLMSDLNPDITVNDADVFEVSKTRFDPTTWYAEAPDGTKIALQ